MHSRYYNADWGRFINADALVGEVGNLLGHNMVTYCRNNPIMFEDSSEYDQQDIGRTRKRPGSIRGMIIAAAIRVSAAGGMWLLRAGIYQRLSFKWVGKVGKTTKNVMHILRNARRVVQYVGITNNFATRAAEHLSSKGIRIEPLMKGLNRSDARAVEQH